MPNHNPYDPFRQDLQPGRQHQEGGDHGSRWPGEQRSFDDGRKGYDESSRDDHPAHRQERGPGAYGYGLQSGGNRDDYAQGGQGGLGPADDGSFTLQSPAVAPAWGGIPSLDEAGPAAIRDYLGAYGPASPEHVAYWLGEGLSAGRTRLTSWWAELEPDLAEIDVEGERRWVLAEHEAELGDVRPETTVVLLPGKDDWVMGPGTKDAWVVPAAQRTAMTRGANPVVVDGVVRGTWKVHRGAVELDAAALPVEAEAERERLEGLLRTR